MVLVSELERLIELVPDTRSFIEDISAAIVEYPSGVRKSVYDHVEDQMQTIEDNCRLSDSGKFKVFIGKFLYVQIKTEIADKVIQYLSERFDTPNDLAETDADSLTAKFREFGYRFPNKAEVVIEISKKLRDKFNGKIDNYVAFVDNNYFDDPILKVKGVGFKTRDIALSSFTKKYSLVDVHIINVLSRTGLILNAYLYGFDLTTDRSVEKNYLEITKLLDKLSTEAGMMPFEFDQTLWFFGKDYCSPMICTNCLARRCVKRDFKNIIS